MTPNAALTGAAHVASLWSRMYTPDMGAEPMGWRSPAGDPPYVTVRQPLADGKGGTARRSLSHGRNSTTPRWASRVPVPEPFRGSRVSGRSATLPPLATGGRRRIRCWVRVGGRGAVLPCRPARRPGGKPTQDAGRGGAIPQLALGGERGKGAEGRAAAVRRLNRGTGIPPRQQRQGQNCA